MSADAGRDLGGGRRVGVQVPLVQPDRADVHRVARRRRARPSPRISSVEPPPMSTTSTGVAGVVAQVADRAVEGQRGLLGAGDHLGRRRRAARGRPRRRRRRWRRRGWPRWRRTGSASTPCAAIERGVLVDRGERARQRLVGEPAGAVDVLAEPDDPHLAPDRRRSGERRPTSSLIVLVPQSIAATRSSPCWSRSGPTQGPEAHHSPSSVEHLVAERVHAAALGEGLAGQHVQALDPVGHAAGGDPVDLGDLADRGPRRRGRPRARRRTPRRARGRRRAGPASPSSARTPRGCRSATRRAGRSGRRSSGTACRRRAAARW